MNEIIKGVYLGDIDDAKDKEMLKKINCTHILIVTNLYDPFYPDVPSLL